MLQGIDWYGKDLMIFQGLVRDRCFDEKEQLREFPVPAKFNYLEV
jgi:hypothetical protein